MRNDDEADRPKQLKITQSKKTRSSKLLVEKKIKKTEREIHELNQETKRILWEEEREVIVFS